MSITGSATSFFQTALAAALLSFSLGWVAQPVSAAQPRVTYLEGEAGWGTETQSPTQLRVGNILLEGSVVTTGADGKLEILLPDGSVLRIGPNSEMKLTRAYFSKEKRTVSVSMRLGRLWAKVARKLWGPEESFEINAPTAVAGIRGTVLAVDVDKANYVTAVKVYSGKVEVKPVYQTEKPGSGSERKEVAGPSEVRGPAEVDLETWSKIVASGQMILVGADRRAGETVPIDEIADAWTLWNRQRDKRTP